MSWSLRTWVYLLTATLIGILAISILISAQTPTKPIVRFTATTENVATPGQAVRIELFAWSTDAERDQLAKAWTSPPQPPPTVVTDAAPAGRGRGNRGGAAAANAGAAPAAAAARGGDAAAAAGGDDAQAAAARGGRGGRGGRGARGGGGGDAPPPPPPPMTPTTSLAATIQKASSVGMLWTSETVGYSIRYAYRVPQPDGGERIILAT